MWKDFVGLDNDNSRVIAKMTESQTFDSALDKRALKDALQELGVADLHPLDEGIDKFLNAGRSGDASVYQGFVVAEKRNATLEITVSSNQMQASMTVTGAYGGRPLIADEIVKAISDAGIKKGIHKPSLKKVLVASQALKPGETFTQLFAQGKEVEDGKNAYLKPLIKDVMKRVLAPKDNDAFKVDMRDFGSTITVEENDPVMERLSATPGREGFNVLGEILAPKPGEDVTLQEGNGTHISPDNPNILLATTSGMPIIRDKTVDVEQALCLNNVSVATGHVKFKGSVIVAGDVEPGMIVRATGDVTVGGFIESANVQAQGSITVAKGIIGHSEQDDDTKTCVVKAGGAIKANYAQYAELQANHDIYLTVHAMGNDIRCGDNLYVTDENSTQGTLSGGHAKVGGKVVCYQLGVEGDTATVIEAYAKFALQKERLAKQKALYVKAQEATMDIVRKELVVKKRDKSERSQEDIDLIDHQKKVATAQMEKAKLAVEKTNEQLDVLLKENTVEATNKVFTHVTICFGGEKVTTKRIHGPSVFYFNQYEIQCEAKMNNEDIPVGDESITI